MGLKAFAEREIVRVLGRRATLLPREDPEAVPFRYEGELRRLLSLRTVVAVYLVVEFEAPRPKALLGHQHFQRLLEQLQLIASAGDFASFRIAAAGRDSAVFQRLAGELKTRTGLRHDPEAGDLLLRFRPSASRGGWEVLLRLSPRPLSARPWRVCNMAGGLNATVAAAMLDAVPFKADDAFINLMCGSGTLLIERLAQGKARRLVGVDNNPAALDCARANLQKAGAVEEVELLHADATALKLPCSFNVIVADAPWGDRIGSHEDNRKLYPELLREAARLALAGAHFVLLTHDVRLFERVLEEHRGLWALSSSHRVFHGGHYPRIYVLKSRY